MNNNPVILYLVVRISAEVGQLSAEDALDEMQANVWYNFSSTENVRVTDTEIVGGTLEHPIL